MTLCGQRARRGTPVVASPLMALSLGLPYGGCMPVWQPAIPQRLRPHLLAWVGYDFTSTETVHHGVPSLGVTVVLSLADPIDCGWLDGGARQQLDALVSGLHTTPALIHSGGAPAGPRAVDQPALGSSAAGAAGRGAGRRHD